MEMKKPVNTRVYRLLVETTGIEPVTPCMSSKYSNQLSYASKQKYYSISQAGMQEENENL